MRCHTEALIFIRLLWMSREYIRQILSRLEA